MKNKIITTFIFLMGLSINAQSHKTFSPIKGEIIFSEVSQITDKILYEKSLKTFQKNFKESLENSLSKDSDNKDENMEEMIDLSTDMTKELFSNENNNAYHHKFDYAKIIAYKTSNGKIMGDYEIINTNENIVSSLAKIDSSTVYQQNPYLYSNNIILKLAENKKERKNIQGYDCYKVKYLYKENIDKDDDYFQFAGNVIYTREMWVTDKIKSLYHPIVFDKIILEKYYPLEIVETQNDIKGFERRYSLETITLSN